MSEIDDGVLEVMENSDLDEDTAERVVDIMNELGVDEEGGGGAWGDGNLVCQNIGNKNRHTMHLWASVVLWVVRLYASRSNIASKN